MKNVLTFFIRNWCIFGKKKIEGSYLPGLPIRSESIQSEIAFDEFTSISLVEYDHDVKLA